LTATSSSRGSRWREESHDRHVQGAAVGVPDVPGLALVVGLADAGGARDRNLYELHQRPNEMKWADPGSGYCPDPYADLVPAALDNDDERGIEIDVN
jgi:hypothetical protein